MILPATTRAVPPSELAQVGLFDTGNLVRRDTNVPIKRDGQQKFVDQQPRNKKVWAARANTDVLYLKQNINDSC